MSPKYTLDIKDLEKIGKGLLIAVGGALLTYLVQVLPDVDLGPYQMILFPILSALLNAGLKFLDGEK